MYFVWLRGGILVSFYNNGLSFPCNAWYKKASQQTECLCLIQSVYIECGWYIIKSSDMLWRIKPTAASSFPHVLLQGHKVTI